MKQPKIAAIPDASPQTSFSEKVKQAKKNSDRSKAKAVKKSYSIAADQADFITNLALKLGQKRGKSMTESEALRAIIDAYREQS